MAEGSPTAWQKTVEVANVIGAFAIVGGLVVTVLAWTLAWPDWAIGSSLTAMFLGSAMMFARLVSVRADAPIDSISEWRQGYRNETGPLTSLPPRPLVESRARESGDERRVLLEELEEEYEPLKKLQPNFIDHGNEYVPAHNDDNGVIVRGTSPEKESFHVLVRSYGNEHPHRKVRSLQRVSFRLSFLCLDRATLDDPPSVAIRRGAWLTEAETEIDFPAHCPPRRAVIVTVEGDNKRVCAVRRDSDSSYKKILPLREELSGSVYNVLVSLLVESRERAEFQYILETIREPGLELRLTNAAIWKSEHLYKFVGEGMVLSEKLHEIWKDVQSQFPYPARKPSDNFFVAPRDAFDYAENSSRIRAAEREQEAKIIEGIKDWEARAADFVELYIGVDEREKFLKTLPSIEDGFNREQKTRSQRFRIFPRAGEPVPPPTLPYWDLSGAVRSRTDKLMKIIREL